MAQTFFIDSDEEIISVIGYLRKSPDIENYFVFPKRSLVLQSAVNLRLFQREAEKQGKHIVIISQDENGRQLAERVGILTKEYATEINSLRPDQAAINQENTKQSAMLQKSSSVVRSDRSPAMPPSNHLGSETFSSPIAFQTAVSPKLPSQVQGSIPQTQTVSQSNEHRLRIRDTSPQYQTSLNSVRNDIKSPVALTQKSVEQPMRTMRPEAQLGTSSVPRQTINSSSIPQTQEADLSGRNQRLERFFQRGPGEVLSEIPSQTGARATSSSQSPQSHSSPSPATNIPPAFSPSEIQPVKASSSWKKLIFSVGSVVLLSGIGVAVYFLLPKASVFLTPHEITHEVEAKFEGKTIAPIGDQNSDVVPVRKIEKNYGSTVSVEATGKASSGNQKARGTIIISNEYSSDTQPLIATTRFETSDGKIFRLAESTTVPGMTIVDGKRQPGIAEAVVIADAPGDTYNISPADFTIPGFKGVPKYEKIRATSSKNFSGGGGSEESMSSVTKEDIDSGIQKLKEQSKKDFLAAVEQELLPDERPLIDSVEVTDTQIGTLPLAGSLGERFDMNGSFTGRIFVVSEKILKEKLALRNLPERKGVSFRVTDATISYESVLPRYDEDQVTFTVRSTLKLSSNIETDQLQAELLGLDEDGIKSILEKHAEIKKIEVNFSPEFLFHNIPRDEKRVSVQVISEQ